MQEVHETDTVHLNSSRYARQIKICTKLLKRIIDETHEETLFDDLEKEFGPYNSFSYIPLSREKITTPEQQKIYRDKVSNGYIMIEKKYNKDCEVLFRIIKKYHRNWWS